MKRALVTGGGGFIGSAIVQKLRERGVDCLVIGRGRYPELERQGAVCVRGDIRDRDFLMECSKGIDTFFHVASLTGMWGKRDDFYSINILGTENVLFVCEKNGIERLVYTSTPSVVFDGKDIIAGDESLPYPEKFLCDYAETKARAEQLVLGSNNNTVLSCSIRPHLVWGPGDPHLIPRLLERGRRRQLKIVGNGENLVDVTYIDNAASAHLLAADNLEESGSAAGKAYFISQGEPVYLWKWINELYIKTGIPVIEDRIGFSAAYSIGWILEKFHRVFFSKNEPKMTRFIAEQLAKTHYFSISRAKADLGYDPIVSTEEGMGRLLKWIRTL